MQYASKAIRLLGSGELVERVMAEPAAQTSRAFELATNQVSVGDDNDDTVQSQQQQSLEQDLQKQRCDAPVGLLLLVSTVALGLGVAQLVAVPDTWPGRHASARWLCYAVAPSTWVSGFFASRLTTAVNFVTLCIASIALLSAWSDVGPAKVACASVHVGCDDGDLQSCCHRCQGGGTLLEHEAAAAWQRGCIEGMLATGRTCWYPDWCDGIERSFVLCAAASIDTFIATWLVWSRWVVVAPRSKEEEVASRQSFNLGKSLQSFRGKSFGNLPSFLFRPQKATGQIGVPPPSVGRIAPNLKEVQNHSRDDTGEDDREALNPGGGLAAGKLARGESVYDGNKHVEEELELLKRADRLANRVEQAEKDAERKEQRRREKRDKRNAKASSRSKATEPPPTRQLKVSLETGSIIGMGNKRAGDSAGADNSCEGSGGVRNEQDSRRHRSSGSKTKQLRSGGEGGKDLGSANTPTSATSLQGAPSPLGPRGAPVLKPIKGTRGSKKRRPKLAPTL
eukprot:SAG11_NODE_2995_length_2781_cov_6.108501_1_plen_509_part_00